MTVHSGWHFLQIPGPTNIPHRILRAMNRPSIDHRASDFGAFGLEIIARMKPIFKTSQDVVIFPGSGTGGTEAALVNTLSAGDKILMYETGMFAELWRNTAEALGIDVEYMASDWRTGVDAGRIEERLQADTQHEIKAVCIVHNETACGITSDLPAVRRAIDAADHPALFMCDLISSLASIDFRFDEWGVDVAIAGAQKGLMLPPGLGMNAVSAKALKASRTSTLPKSFWRWDKMLEATATGYFPYTLATNMLFGLEESLNMMDEEGFENVLARHTRLGTACRAAVEAWGFETVAANAAEASNSVSAIFVPEGHSADSMRKIAYDQLNMSLGGGLGRLADRAFRIGHMGYVNELMLCGTLSGVEMAMARGGIPYESSGVEAAQASLNNA